MKILLKYILISTMSIGATLGVTEVILPMVTEETITVTFDTQGGTFIEPLEIISETSLDTIPEPSKEGCIFDGFYINDEKIDDTTIFYEDSLLIAKYIKATYIITLNTSGSPLESIEGTYLEEITLPEATKEGFHFIGWFIEDIQYDVITVISNMTLEARFEKVIDTITIAFDTKGGTFIHDVTILKNTTLETMPESTKTGHTFIGFYLNDSLVDVNTVFSSDAVLEARYEVNHYTISFETTGNAVDAIQGSYLETITLPPATKEGYIFTGWYVEDIRYESILVTSNLTLEARFEAIPDDYVQIQFNTNGGNYIEPVEIVISNTLVEIPTPIKTGYTFDGFYLNDVLVTIETTFDTSVILEARYSINTYTLSFITDGDALDAIEVSYMEEVILPQATKLGFNFTGWYLEDIRYESILVTSNLTLEARFEAIPDDYVQIQFNTNGGNYIEPVEIVTSNTLVEIPTPIKTGYTFDGFYLNDVLVTIETTFDTSVILEARYSINTYTLSFINLYGPVTTIEANYLEVVTLPDSVFAGYNFGGWFIGETQFTVITVTSDMSFRGVYTNQYYTMTLISQTGALDPIEMPYNEAYTLPVLTLEGYVFDGWYTQPNGEGLEITNESGIRDDITLYANFVLEADADIATITFSVLGEIVESLTQQSVKNSVIDLVEPDDINGLKFMGWEAPCDDAFDTCIVYQSRFGVTESITLIARFESIIPVHYFDYEILYEGTTYASISLTDIKADYEDDFLLLLDDTVDLYIPGYINGYRVSQLDETFKDLTFTIRNLYLNENLSVITALSFNQATIINFEITHYINNSRGFENTTFTNLTFNEGLYSGYQHFGYVGATIDQLHFETKNVSIGDSMFLNANINSISFGQGAILTSIGQNSFQGATIGTMDFKEGLETIGANAFKDAIIETIELPDSLIRVDNNALNSASITSIIAPTNNQILWFGEDVFHTTFVLTEMAPNYFTFGDILVKVTLGDNDSLDIPEDVRVIATGVFRGLTLNNLAIPPSVLVVGEEAFQNVSFNGQMTLSEGIRGIGPSAFENITDVNETSIVEIPSSLIYFGDFAFKNASLRSVIVKENIDYIYNGQGIFQGLEATTVTLNINYQYLPYNMFDQADIVSFDLNSTELVSLSSGSLSFNSITTFTWSEGLDIKNLSRDVFNTDLMMTTPYFSNGMFIFSDVLVIVSDLDGDIVVPDGVKKIASNAFLTNINSLDLNQVEILFSNSLANVSIAEDVIITERLTYIDSYVFGFSQSSVNMTFANPEAYQHDAQTLFADRYYFTMNANIMQTFPSNEDGLYILGNVLVGYDENVFDPTQPLVIDEGIEYIANEAFRNIGLTSVTFPSTLKVIGYEAFYDNNLTTLNFPASIVSIQVGAFNENPLETVSFAGIDDLMYVSQLSFDLRIFESMEGTFKTIDGILFMYEGLEDDLVIPSDVKMLAEGFLRYDWYPLIIGRHTFNTVTIPGTVEKLSDGAFYESSISTLIFNEDSDLFFPTQAFIYSLIDRIEFNGSMAITNPYFLFDLQNIETIILPEDFDYTNIYQYDDNYSN